MWRVPLLIVEQKLKLNSNVVLWTNSAPPRVHLIEPGQPCCNFHAVCPRTADWARFTPFHGDCAGSTRKSNMFGSLSEVRRSMWSGAQHRPCRCSLQTESQQTASPGKSLGLGPPSTAHDERGKWKCVRAMWGSRKRLSSWSPHGTSASCMPPPPCNSVCCESPQPFFSLGLGQHGDFICRKTSSGYRGRKR